MCGGSFFIIRMGHINYANIKTSAIVHYFKEFVKKKKKKKKKKSYFSLQKMLISA